MAYISKEIREKVWNKYDKSCAYCGTKLEYKQLQIDHIEAYWHNCEDDNSYGVKKGKHELDNFNPSCARCNRWKGTFNIEKFRKQIQQQIIRLKKYNSNYRMAFDYHMIIECNKPIEFFFERYEKLNK